MDHHSEGKIPNTRDHSSKFAKTPCNFPLTDNANLEDKLHYRLDGQFGLMPRCRFEAPMIQYTLSKGIEYSPTEKRHYIGLDLSRSSLHLLQLTRTTKPSTRFVL